MENWASNLIDMCTAVGGKILLALAVFIVGSFSIRQMSGQVSRGSAGEYQADERAGVAGLSWRVSG